MRRLMAARSVAIVGASERPEAQSGFVLRNLRDTGFTGRVLPVHPTARRIYGHPAAPSLSALGEVPDVVVVSIPAAGAGAVVAEAAGLGIRAAVVLGSGFGEAGEAGRRMQATMAADARAAGMALCGPNCVGLYNLRERVALFSSRLAPGLPVGDVAVISHSGATAIGMAHNGRLALSHVVSAGNAAVTDVADYLGYFAASGEARVVALLLEQIADPPGFARAMAKAHEAGIVVVAMRSGRSIRGAAATAAHTGALAGSNEAFRAFFRRHGVIEADDLDTVMETCVLAAARRAPARPGLAAIGISGGGLAHLADLAESAGVALADLGDRTRAALGELLPAYVHPANPLDLTGIVFGDPARYARALDLLAGDPAVGQIAVLQDAPRGIDAAGAAEYQGFINAIAGYGTGRDVPLAVLSLLSGGMHPDVEAPLTAAGLPVLRGGSAAMAAIAGMLAVAPAHIATELVAPDPFWRARLAGGAPLTERETKLFLAAHGIAVTREALATDADMAARLAAEFAAPVALKIESPDIQHKTEAGGIRLGVMGAEAVRSAYGEIITAARLHAPTARIAGVLVQEMVTGGTEALVGLSRAAPFGLTLTVGPGGVLVELLGGHALEVLPLDQAAAERLIGSSRLAPLLAGFRGQAPGDRTALAALLCRISAVAQAYDWLIEALDLNPVAVLPEGQGAKVLDALLIRPVNVTTG